METDMQKELLPDFLHLYHSLGPRRGGLKTLLDAFRGNPADILNAAGGALTSAGLNHAEIRSIRSERHSQVDRDLAWADSARHCLICFDDDAYPALLREISDFPLLLYGNGDPDLLRYPQIAIVGSRNCTPGGAQNAHDFAAQLSQAGLIVTSGLALGIDAAAHRGALQTTGKTIAVTGTGLDLLYPRHNRRLAEEILEQGLIVSEFPLGTEARPANFPQRNRIISGLALATLVVEAAKRSGSLITARLAAEQGREVFAVPGSIHNPQARGCHQLLRDGATIAETTRDIAVELDNLIDFVLEQQIPLQRERSEQLDDRHQKLLLAIGYDPVNCDILVQRSGLTIDKLSSMLVLLEINDLIQSAPGGCYVRI
jgi:DNA processing protein